MIIPIILTIPCYGQQLPPEHSVIVGKLELNQHFREIFALISLISFSQHSSRVLIKLDYYLLSTLYPLFILYWPNLHHDLKNDDVLKENRT